MSSSQESLRSAANRITPGKGVSRAALLACVLACAEMSERDELEQIVVALRAGDRLAFLRLSRLVTSYLARLRAYDFRDEWPDLVQEVVAAVAAAHASDRLRDREALAAFVRSVTRNKLADRLKQELRLRGELRLAWEVATLEGFDPLGEPMCGRLLDLRRALAALPDKKGTVLVRVYMEGKSYEEVALETGIPLGTLKRYLRDGLAELRRRLVEEPGE